MKQFQSVLESKIILRTKAFDVREDVLLFSDSKTSHHITALHRGAVVMLPRLENGNFLLVRQYRHSIKESLLEFPAGTLEKFEEPLLAAKRELVEEVQYSAEQWLYLGTQYPTPGFCNEIQHCFLATGLKPQAGTPDDDEIIQVEALSSKEIENAIVDGRISDAKSISIYTKAKLRGLL
ncbi:MAG: NUDIX hydrolase [SAR324 cluster bacterium]|uniref:NUDIX hydrolase n=1 Tax=SAR324 cluster bacterium TaxID=2024889 RepID=A0A7X9FQT4_9DELT|nr:NUDIX hydrolase [SAR324 cluster bacterium]